jgi:NADP-dependent 3-hydroxy acid dehydrogenase YdfG
MADLKGKVAVITGATGSIGSAISLELIANGAELHLIGRDFKKIRIDHKSDDPAGSNVTCHKADLSKQKNIISLLEQLSADLFRVDLLIHSIGVIRYGGIEETTMDDFQRQFDVNVRAPYLITQGLLELIKKTRGQIVFINSSSGKVAGEKTGTYSATKFALKGIADSLRREVNGDGVRVISVFPGRTAGKMQEYVHKCEKRRYEPKKLLQPSDIAQSVLTTITLPPTAEITDVHIRPFIDSSK